MASEYGYITLSDLENYMGMDIDSRDPELTDTKVESMITLAERLINGYIGQSLDGTIYDSIKTVTMIIASRIVNNWLVRETTIDGEKEELMDETVISLLSRYLSNEQQDSSDIINTYSGRDYQSYGAGWYYLW